MYWVALEADGSTLSTVCSGASPAYTYTRTYPWLVVAGSSSTLNVATDVCTTVSYTATSATCSCSLSVTSFLTDNSGSSDAGSMQLASVTTTSRLTAVAVRVFRPMLLSPPFPPRLLPWSVGSLPPLHPPHSNRPNIPLTRLHANRRKSPVLQCRRTHRHRSLRITRMLLRWNSPIRPTSRQPLHPLSHPAWSLRWIPRLLL